MARAAARRSVAVMSGVKRSVVRTVFGAALVAGAMQAGVAGASPPAGRVAVESGVRPAATAAVAPQPPDCPLLQRRRPVEHPFPGTGLALADGFGGLAASSSTVRFAVTGTREALAGVRQVTFAVDGTVKHVDPTARFGYTWGDGYVGEVIGRGEHTITATLTLRSGVTASVSFPESVTGCRFVEFTWFPPSSPTTGTSELIWSSGRGSDTGPVLTAVSARAVQNVVTALPGAVRGRRVGRMTITRPGAGDQTFTLRAPRRGTVLLSGSGAPRVVLRPGRTEFLTITGLPSVTAQVDLVLAPPGTRLIRAADPCHMALARGVMRDTAGAVATDTSGGYYPCAPRRSAESTDAVFAPLRMAARPWPWTLALTPPTTH